MFKQALNISNNIKLKPKDIFFASFLILLLWSTIHFKFYS